MRIPALLPLAVVGVSLSFPATAAGAPTPIAGRYVTSDGSAQVEVAPCGRDLCGRIVRTLKQRPGAATTDINNTDPALRKRPILGLLILSGLAAAGDGWRGRIYDPRSGKTYRSVVTRRPDRSLEVQGCIALFCRTQIWAESR